MKNFKDYLIEMDKSQTPPGRDGSGSDPDAGKKQYTAKMTTADKMMKDAHKAMMKSMSNSDKVKKGWRNPNMKEELTADEMFDLIEEMAQEISEELQMDLEQVWEELDEFSDNELLEACNCWKGYKRKPGTKPCAEGSCVKEEIEQLDEVGNTTKGQKLLRMVNKRAVNRLTSKKADTDPAYAKKAQETHLAADERLKEDTNLEEAAVDAKGYKSSTGGLTQKGRDAYNRKEGSNLKAPVTTPPSKLKKGSKSYNRRKSFCARMSGVEGPMRKPNGEPTRKALALRKWNC